MLDSELNNNAADNSNNEANGRTAEPAAPPSAAPAVPAAVFQAPQVLFQPPAPPVSGRDSGAKDTGTKDSGTKDAGAKDTGAKDTGAKDSGGRDSGDGGEADADGGGRTSRRTRGGRGRGGRGRDLAGAEDLAPASVDAAGAVAEAEGGDADAPAEAEGVGDESDEQASGRRRRRRNGRSRNRGAEGADADAAGAPDDAAGDESDGGDEDETADEGGASGRRRRRKRRRGAADTDVPSPDDPPDTVVHVREPHSPADDVRAIKGSTRLEAKKQRRREGRESGRRRPPVVTESEFLARRESVERSMVVRQRGDRIQIAVLEDGVLVEHYVNRTTHQSYVGNVYLGKVQNVLPSMEAAFVDIGKGRNAVLYAGEVNFDASGLEGQPKRIESALKPGQSVIVQVTKDPVGHKGARLTSQVSLPGRYLVYVPGASMTGISRKLPDTERTRLKHILKKVIPENAGVIVRTAAEGAAEAELDRDVTRLAAQWENIAKKAKTASAPALLYGEPDLTIRVVRDVFNEDFSSLTVHGEDSWGIIDEYVRYVAPHLADRLTRWDDADGGDVFAAYRIDEQLAKALDRKVWLPSGGSLVIDRTEAMTVIDVNTGKFTGQGGNLEETVTRNNLEAAEEIVRQLRLRDVGGIVVIDFIDMVLESNRELVLRRLLECLARDRTKHQVAEVTSLGLVQMTRKRVGAGLLEAFSQPCECCNGRGVVITLEQAEPTHRAAAGAARRPVPAPPATRGNGKNRGSGASGQLTFDETAEPAAETGLAAPAEPAAAEPPAAAPAAAEPPAAGPPAAVSQPGPSPEPAGNGGRRTRRPTAGGTAFATVVHVEETGLTPATPVAAPVITAPEEETTPAVRRTRAGSAVARVSVVTPPAAEPEPDPLAPEATAPEPTATAEDEPTATAQDEPTATPEQTPASAEREAPAEAAVSAPEEAPVAPQAFAGPEPVAAVEGPAGQEPPAEAVMSALGAAPAAPQALAGPEPVAAVEGPAGQEPPAEAVMSAPVEAPAGSQAFAGPEPVVAVQPPADSAAPDEAPVLQAEGPSDEAVLAAEAEVPSADEPSAEPGMPAPLETPAGPRAAAEGEAEA